MASINISEGDFDTLASAAMDAKDCGNTKAADALDKLARKTNAALTNARTTGMRSTAGPGGKPLRWLDVPSVLMG